MRLAEARYARERELDAAYRQVGEIAGRLNRAHADLVTLTAAVLEGELWSGDGIRSPEHWLGLYAGLSHARARDVVRLARRSRELPATVAALSSARISMDHAAVVARFAPANHDIQVAQTAALTTVSQLSRVLSRYQFHDLPVAPDLVEDEGPAGDGAEGSARDGVPGMAGLGQPGASGASEVAERERMAGDGYPFVSASAVATAGSVEYACLAPELSMSTVDGRFTLRYSAPADIGALVEQAVREAKDALFTGGHAGATHADGLAEVATRSLAAVTTTGRAARYRVYVHLSTDGGWVGGRGGIPPRIAAKYACDGVIQPVWETGGTPVNVGREQRIVPDRTRRLIEDRDRGCRYPGCVATQFVEIHHIQHWAEGGPTDLHTMISLCPHHHDAHHRGQFTITGTPDALEFTDPHGHHIGYRPPPESIRPPGLRVVGAVGVGAVAVGAVGVGAVGVGAVGVGAEDHGLGDREGPAYPGASGYAVNSHWFQLDRPHTHLRSVDRYLDDPDSDPPDSDPPGDRTGDS